MCPRLFEIPLFGSLIASWPVLILLVAGVMAVVSQAGKIAGRSQWLAQLAAILPVLALIAALVIFLETPFGKIPINSYGFMIMIGFLLATGLSARLGRRIGVPSDVVLDTGIISMIFGILGAKINYLLQYPSGGGGGLRIFDVSDGGLNPIGCLLLGPVPFVFYYTRARKRQLPIKVNSLSFAVMAVFVIVFAVVGARGLHIYQHQDDYNLSVLKDWQSGFVFYGGLIGGLGAGMVYVRLRGVGVLTVMDLAAPAIMIGLAFGRVGCFLNGCCWGKASSLPWAVEFPKDNPSTGHLGKVHPTQLYETFACLLIAAILTFYWKNRQRGAEKRSGAVIALMAMLYGAWRFSVEFLRDDPRPEWLGSLTYSQTLSLFFFVLCGLWFVFLNRPSASVAPPGPTSASS